jgi:hypothetical protein
MFFSKPNIEKLLKNENERGLIKALSYDDDKIKFDAIKALCRMNTSKSIHAIHQFFDDSQNLLETFLSDLEIEIID